MEKQARECYAEAIDYSPEELVKILVIDGCFIIELIFREAYRELREKDDPVFTRSCMLQFLGHDFILLENQVLWMVLEILFDLTKDSSRRNKPLIQLATDFFRSSVLSYRTLPLVQLIA
jgi:hypothetical protein